MHPIAGLVCVILAIASPYLIFWAYSIRKIYKKNLKFLSAISESAGLTSKLDIENNHQRAMDAAVDGIEWEISS